METRSIPGYFGGISQMSPELRQDSQVSDLINCTTDATNGTRKRPGTSVVKALTTAGTVETAFIGSIDRGPGDQWALMITDDATTPVQAWRVSDGTKATITHKMHATTTDPKVYVLAGSGSPKSKLKITTIGDKTLICNTTVTTTALTGTSAKSPCVAIVECRRAIEGMTYNIRITLSDANNTEISTTVTYVAVAGATTETVAEGLAVVLNATFAGATYAAYPQFKVWFLDSYVVIQMNSWSKQVAWTSEKIVLSVTVSDGIGGGGLVAVNPRNISGTSYDNFVSVTNAIENMPTTIPAGSGTYYSSAGGPTTGTISDLSALSVKIFSEVTQDAGYYLRWSKTKSTWEEDAIPAGDIGVDGLTLPVELKKTGSTTFDLQVYDYDTYWSGTYNNRRAAGDNESCPQPSFIGKVLHDVFAYKNRIGFLSDNRLHLSGIDNPSQWFPATAIDVLDSDPISAEAVSITRKQVILKDAIVFDDSIVINGQGDQQFQLVQGGNILSPKTTSLEATTSFSFSTSCRPMSLGNSAYFIQNFGDYSHLMEYYVTPDASIKDAQRLTSHVPSLLSKDMERLVGSTTAKYILLQPAYISTGGTIFVNQFETQVENGAVNKTQNAFHRWKFERPIIGLCLFDTSLYLVTKSGSSYRLEYLDLTNGDLENVHLDHIESLTGVYNSTTDITTFSPSFAPATIGLYYTTLVDTVTGKAVDFAINGSTLEVVGDISTVGRYKAGRCFPSSIFPSQLVARDRQGLPLLDRGIQLAHMDVAFRNTGYFRMKCTPLGTFRQSVTKDFWWMYLNVDSLDTVVLKSSSEIPYPWRMPCMGDMRGMVLEITSASHLPFQIDSSTYSFSTFIK